MPQEALGGRPLCLPRRARSRCGHGWRPEERVWQPGGRVTRGRRQWPVQGVAGSALLGTGCCSLGPLPPAPSSFCLSPHGLFAFQSFLLFSLGGGTRKSWGTVAPSGSVFRLAVVLSSLIWSPGQSSVVRPSLKQTGPAVHTWSPLDTDLEGRGMG